MPRTLFASEQPLSKIFSNDYVFNIPGYQRPYAWTTENARELFEDLLGFMQAAGGQVAEMPPYFLGSIVLVKSEGSPQSEVIDGQQRLTTLTILLSAIREFVPQNNANDITMLLYERGSTIMGTTDRFRLTLRDRDKEFFHRNVQREGGFKGLVGLSDTLPDAQKNIQANAALFSEKLEKLSQEERLWLAQFIVTRCFLVVVATPDLNSAYRIFSVLNSRGLDLSATDILKAKIVGEISGSQRDAYTKLWEDAEDDLGRDAFGDLFSHVRMVYRKAKPQGTLLKEFSEHVSEINQPVTLIDNVVLPMARAYGEMLSSSFESTTHAEEVNTYLQWLNRLEFQDWVPPSLAFFIRFRQQPEKIRDFFRDMERLAYWMLVTKKGINERIQRFSKLTEDVEAGQDLWRGDSPLQVSPVEKYEFYIALDGPIYESLYARARSTLLLRLDMLLSGGGASYQYDRVTVEHILPQTPPENSTWLTWFPEVRDRLYWTHRLGNLALLTRNKNSAASNYDFDTKKRAYFSNKGISPFVLTTQVLEKSEWTLPFVEDRQKSILQTFETHWRLTGRKSREEAANS